MEFWGFREVFRVFLWGIMGESRVGFLGFFFLVGVILFISLFLEFLKIFFDLIVLRLKRKYRNNIGSYRIKLGRGEVDGGVGKEMSVFLRRRVESYFF